MTFWSTDLQTGEGKDPKRKFRFTVEFPGLLGTTGPVQGLPSATSLPDGIVWYAKSVTKPAMTISETDHTFLDKKFYFPGRVEWSPVTLTLVDPADPDKGQDAVRQMNQLIQAAGYSMFNNSNDLATMSKSKAVSALGSVVINQLDGDGNIIESWSLKNPFIKDMKFGDLDYTGDELIELSLELRYDWAECTIGATTFHGTGS
jgi:hypothetical protein